MRQSLAILAFAASAMAMPQGVTSRIPAPSPAPAGCSPSVPGKLQLTVVNLAKPNKRGVEFVKRQQAGILTVTLQDSVLTDQAGRVGYIADNYQFQFDQPPQTGAIITSGFSVCANGTLALGGSAIFYQCASGSFYNLYDRSWAAQCNPIFLYTQSGTSGGGGGGAPVTQISDGQPQGPTNAPVTQISDGQVQNPTGKPITQISDGQVQNPTGKPITQISDGQVQNPTGKPVTQISDGQVQNPTGKPVTQISDGQVQNPTGKPITQISDGQVQNPTGAPVTQISDGQVQNPTGKPVTQISDGQVQVPTSVAGPTVTQISDGQPQVPTSIVVTSAPVVPLPTFTDVVTTPSAVIPAPSSNASIPIIPSPSPPVQTTLVPGLATKATVGTGAFLAALIGAVVMI